MKVYIITNGDYDEYHIVGVFDNESLAKDFLSNNKKKLDSIDIEEYELNLPKERDIY